MDLLDSIRLGVASSATQEQRAAAAHAARSVLAALEGNGGAPAMPVASAGAFASPTLHANIQTIATALKAGVPIEKVIDVAVLRLEAAVRERDQRWMAMMRPNAGAAMPGAPWPLGASLPASSTASSTWSTTATQEAPSSATPPTMPAESSSPAAGAEVAPVRSHAAQIPIVPLPTMHRGAPPPMHAPAQQAAAAPRPLAPPPAPRPPMGYAQPATYAQPMVVRTPAAYTQPVAPRPRMAYAPTAAPSSRVVPPPAARASTSNATPAAARSSASPSPPAVLRPAPPPQMADARPSAPSALAPAVAASIAPATHVPVDGSIPTDQA